MHGGYQPKNDTLWHLYSLWYSVFVQFAIGVWMALCIRRTRTFFFFFFFFFFAFFFVGIHWSTVQSPTALVTPPPPRIMILWRSIESTTQIAQLRWRNALAWSPLAQLRWHNVGMVVVGTTTVAQRHLDNVGPTYFCQPYANDVGHVGKNKKWKYLFFDFSEGAFVFLVPNTKLVIKMVLNLNVPFT